MQKVGLFWFNHDLRLDDNATLLRAAAEVDTLICLYCADTAKTGPGSRQPAKLSLRRRKFLFESLQDLEAELNRHGQKLVVRIQPPLEAIAQLITVHNVSHIYRSNHVGSYENTIWTILRKRYGMLTFTQCHTHTLFEPSQLPFTVDQLPSSFSKFRRDIEKMDINSGIAAPLPTPTSLPKPALVADLAWQKRWHEYFTRSSDSPALFKGGASAGRRHLKNYFGSRRASNYKETRNGLDGMDYSTKFSPWLANGSLSTRRIVQQLQGYEERTGANDSTYWILFELLWREYFQWYGHKYQQRLFAFSGIGSSTGGSRRSGWASAMVSISVICRRSAESRLCCLSRSVFRSPPLRGSASKNRSSGDGSWWSEPCLSATGKFPLEPDPRKAPVPVSLPTADAKYLGGFGEFESPKPNQLDQA